MHHHLSFYKIKFSPAHVTVWIFVSRSLIFVQFFQLILDYDEKNVISRWIGTAAIENFEHMNRNLTLKMLMLPNLNMNPVAGVKTRFWR